MIDSPQPPTMPAFTEDVNGCGLFTPSHGSASRSKFRTIVADPPWELQRGPMGKRNGDGEWAAQSQKLGYPTMTVKEISALQIPADDDAHLYIWTVNKYIEATYGIARAWGFEPSTLLTWAKNPKKWNIGGAYANTTEFCLFARRGKLPASQRVMTTWWNWPRGKHSEKPEAFLDVIQQVSPPPYLELFARRNRLGWATWGNECLQHVELVTPNTEISGGTSAASDSSESQYEQSPRPTH